MRISRPSLLDKRLHVSNTILKNAILFLHKGLFPRGQRVGSSACGRFMSSHTMKFLRLTLMTCGCTCACSETEGKTIFTNDDQGKKKREVEGRLSLSPMSFVHMTLNWRCSMLDLCPAEMSRTASSADAMLFSLLLRIHGRVLSISRKAPRYYSCTMTIFFRKRGSWIMMGYLSTLGTANLLETTEGCCGPH